MVQPNYLGTSQGTLSAPSSSRLPRNLTVESIEILADASTCFQAINWSQIAENLLFRAVSVLH